MTKRTYELADIAYGLAGWDAANDTNHTRARDTILNGALPLYEGSEPDATINDRGIMAKNDATAGWVIRISDGTAWVTIPKQAAAVADLNQTIAGPSVGEVQAISDKVDALLAALRLSGAIAT